MCLVAQSCLTLQDPMDCSPSGSSVHGDSPGKNTGVGCHALLQGIFLAQESNQCLLHCRQILYQLSYQGNPLGCLLMVNKLCSYLLESFHYHCWCFWNGISYLPQANILRDTSMKFHQYHISNSEKRQVSGWTCLVPQGQLFQWNLLSLTPLMDATKRDPNVI